MYVSVSRPVPVGLAGYRRRAAPLGISGGGRRRGRGLRGLGAASDYTAVGNFIQRQEGWYPGSISYRNNNPMNLIYAGQPGAVPSTDMVAGTNYPFARFPDYATGYQAMLNQIALDASRGETIAQFTAKIASSPSDNPTLYADNMAAALGLSPSDLLSAAGSGFTDATGTIADLTPSTFDPFDTDTGSLDLTTYLVGGSLLALGLAVAFG